MFKKDLKPSLLDISRHLCKYSDDELESILNIVNGEILTRKLKHKVKEETK